MALATAQLSVKQTRITWVNCHLDTRWGFHLQLSQRILQREARMTKTLNILILAGVLGLMSCREAAAAEVKRPPEWDKTVEEAKGRYPG